MTVIDTGPHDLVTTDAPTQSWIYRANRRVLDAAGYARLRELEDAWIGPVVAGLERTAPDFADAAGLLRALDERLTVEAAAVPTAADTFLADHATAAQFRTVVAQYAIDGLIESQPHLAILPRLPGPARMPVVRVLIDEFGCGNDTQEHARLYHDLVVELGLPEDVESYVDGAAADMLAFVNTFFWLAARAPAPEYFLGAYAYFESSVLYAFRSFAAAAARLGVVGHRYFT